jgi:hypothetical protein
LANQLPLNPFRYLNPEALPAESLLEWRKLLVKYRQQRRLI